MKRNTPEFLVPGIVFAFALLFAVALGVRAQTSPHAGHAAESKTPHADMKAECQARMAEKQAMEGKLRTMDATLDELVAEMNAAHGRKQPDALETAMAAVINELVAQRKASRAMAQDREPAMMAHMAHHMEIHGTKSGMVGAMDCPMMKAHHADAPAADSNRPKP